MSTPSKNTGTWLIHFWSVNRPLLEPVHAEMLEALGPPVGEARALRGLAHAEEAEIEDAVLQAADLVVDDRARSVASGLV